MVAQRAFAFTDAEFAIVTLTFKMLVTTLIYAIRSLVTCHWSCILAFPKGYWEAFKEKNGIIHN